MSELDELGIPYEAKAVHRMYKAEGFLNLEERRQIFTVHTVKDCMKLTTREFAKKWDDIKHLPAPRLGWRGHTQTDFGDPFTESRWGLYGNHKSGGVGWRKNQKADGAPS